MAKFKVTLFLKEIPFQAEAKDLYEVMERLDACCDIIKNPMDDPERLATYQDLARIEHADKDSSLSVSDRPISITYTVSAVGFMLGNGPCGFSV